MPNCTSEQQMNPIGHQTIGMHRAFKLAGQLAQMRELRRIVDIVEEADAAIIAALNDIEGDLAVVMRARRGIEEPPANTMLILDRENVVCPYPPRSIVALSRPPRCRVVRLGSRELLLAPLHSVVQ
jgi:hypothetical protein